MVEYKCHHAGKVRQSIIDNTRPNQESAKIDCDKFLLRVKYCMKQNKIVFIKTCTEHINHTCSEMAYKSLASTRNRQLQKPDKLQTTSQLLKAKAPVNEIVDLLNKDYDVYATTKDVHNFKKRLKMEANGNQSQDTLIKEWATKLVSESKENIVSMKINSENGHLDCLFVQTKQMRDGYKSFPEITHLDSTFCVSIIVSHHYYLYLYIPLKFISD